jgi:CubicO group peptidase (beta-lactamase class C family)
MQKFKFLALLLLLILTIPACKVGRFFIYNFADIKDHKKFPSRTIAKGDHTFQFAKAKKGRQPTNLTINGEDVDFDDYLEEHKTLAFLIIQNDTIQYEKYFRNYDSTSIVPSFSMAKSVISILIGCAIEDGLIQSVDEPVTNYLPELKENGFDKVSIESALQMTSGIDFNESYTNPFGDAATFYYGRDLPKAVSKLELESDPGERFDYDSGNTQILGLILDRVLGDKNISQYLEEKIWKPLGMEYETSWSLDKKGGLEKTFCCLNARAIDYAKIGRLYARGGDWEGKQIVPEA